MGRKMGEQGMGRRKERPTDPRDAGIQKHRGTKVSRDWGRELKMPECWETQRLETERPWEAVAQ